MAAGKDIFSCQELDISLSVTSVFVLFGCWDWGQEKREGGVESGRQAKRIGYAVDYIYT